MFYVKALVSTGSKKDNIIKKNKDTFVISVKEKPEKNMANKKVLDLLASHFGIPVNKIRIINGHHHPHKLLVVEDSA